MEADFLVSFLVTLIVAHIGCSKGTDDPPGHMLPLGSHRPPENPGIDILESAPDPQDFFENYVDASRPFLIRNHARDMPAFKLWNDDYLKSQYGHLSVDVEQGKKENRSSGLWTMTFREFLDKYNDSDVYLVNSLPTEMMGDVWLLKSMLCGGFTKNINDAVAWISSGGTKSVFHFDALDNINCLFDGTKELIFTPRAHTEGLGFKPQGSFSTVDVDRVDMYKYPQFASMPWYNVSMEPGDCLYIPYRWAHQVRSTGRNLAINIWFVHQHRFDYEDCMIKGNNLPDFEPLSRFGLSAGHDAQMRGEMIAFIKARGGAITDKDIPAAENYFGAGQEDMKYIFQFMDSNRDGKIVVKEVERVDYNTFLQLMDVLDKLELENGEGEETGTTDDDDDNVDDDDDDDDENINEIIRDEQKPSHFETNKSEL